MLLAKYNQRCLIHVQKYPTFKSGNSNIFLSFWLTLKPIYTIFIIMKKTIWKRISESQLRKKNKFWSFVAKGKISICVGSSTIPRHSSEILLGGNFKKLGHRKGLNALRKEVSLIMYDPFNLSSIIWCDYIPLFLPCHTV